jgi:KipI family sensor histidine kinase inhibitor
MRIRAYGRSALLVELGSLEAVLGLHVALRDDPPPGLVETVPAARTLVISFDPRETTHAAVSTAVRGRRAHEHRIGTGPEVDVPVRYDGPDLGHVARMFSCSPQEFVRRHLAGRYVVAFLGFAPGFYFLAGGEAATPVPRRATPRTDVLRGAVGLAGEFTGIYPSSGPGGWQIVGHTTADLWDLTRIPSALLEPGTRVRFHEVRS